jgi:ribonuclease Z
VGYRLSTPDGGVVVSGDTAICPALEETATEAEVLVHEVFRRDAVAGLLSDPDAIAAYHSEARDVGALASRADVRRLVLTHCIPPVRDEAYERELIDDVRAGGFEGELVVGRDLATLVF